MHTKVWFQLFVRFYHFVDQHGAEYCTSLDLERVLTAVSDLSREEFAVVFCTEANILSRLASNFSWEGA